MTNLRATVGLNNKILQSSPYIFDVTLSNVQYIMSPHVLYTTLLY